MLVDYAFLFIKSLFTRTYIQICVIKFVVLPKYQFYHLSSQHIFQIQTMEVKFVK